ncbi:uncharacterized protein CBL_13639 [Carabus blaptoides fortunei]
MDVSKSELLQILRTCLHSSDLEYEEELRFKTHLRTVVSQIWHCLCSSGYKDVDMWLLSSRVGIIGMQYLLNNERFYKILDICWELDHVQKQVTISELKLNKNVENVDTFKASVCYGFMNLLSRYTCLFPEKETRKLFTVLFEYSIKQNRHYTLFYQLLAQFVDTFPCLLKPLDFENIFTLLCFNLDKKESSTLLKSVLTKHENYSIDILFHILTESSSWTSKHKFVLLNEVILHEETILHDVRHEDFVTGLMYGLAKPHLSSASTKLYHTVVKLIQPHLWQKYYYPSFHKIVTSEDKPTVCHTNLFKHYLPKTFERFPKYCMELVDAVRNKPACAMSLMNLVLIGKRQSLFSSDFDFDSIINFGVEHCDQVIRNLAFEILCVTGDCTTADTLNKIRKFLIMNINAADQVNREMIRKTFNTFLKKLHQILTKKRNNTLSGEETIARFLNWLLFFLLNTFQKRHNYQRITLSLQLIHMSLRYFSLAACADMKSDRLKTFIEKHKIFLNIKTNLDKFVLMLTVCDSERDQVLQLIFDQFLPQELLASNIDIERILEDAKKKLGDCNMGESEMGEKLAEFAIKFMHSTGNSALDMELQNLQDLMKAQWMVIKSSDSDNVVADGNPLHCLISLTVTLLPYYKETTYLSLLVFIEEVVFSLLSVFEIRAMVPFTGEFCKGVAKVFMDETLDVFACTGNCMWLTLKACCKLAAKITSMLKTDQVMYRTLEIIFAIIRRCYHKGALEVAGNTLSDLVSYATKNEQSLDIIDSYTKNVLERIPKLPEDSTQTTVRRAAEIRIFLSTLAVSDKRMNMPLFHKTMVFLVSFLGKCILQMPYNPIPVVHYVILHILKPIVMDTAVEVPIVEYLGLITLYCLQSFESSEWRVRNAALQTFSAVASRIHGQNVSSNDAGCQQHAVNLEEIFFRHPRVFSYIVMKLSESSTDFEGNIRIVVPILTFIGMSYVRGNEFLNLETRFQMETMTRSVSGIINQSTNPLVFMLAIKAFTSLTSHKALEGEIEKLIGHLSSGRQLTKNEFLSYVFTIKSMFDKVAENAQASMVKDTILESIDAHMFALLVMTRASGNALENVLAGLILVGENSTNIDTDQTYSYITYVITHPDIVAEVPMIWTWIEKHLAVVLGSADLNLLFELVLRIMIDDTPAEIKAICFKQISIRAAHSEDDKQLCSRALLNSLILYLYNGSEIPVKYLADLCIELILTLNMACMNADVYHSVQRKLVCFEEHGFYDTYVIVSCLVTLQFSVHNLETTTFYYWCVEICNKYIDEDKINILILKSVICAAKYATRNQISDLQLRTLQLCYRMLQLGRDELNDECADILAFCFQQARTYAYVNMLNLVNSKYLLPYLGVHHSLEFLIQVFIQQSETIPIERNVFEKKPILSIETCIISDIIQENIKILITSTTQTELATIFTWFTERTEFMNTKYVQLVRDMFAFKRLGY